MAPNFASTNAKRFGDLKRNFTNRTANLEDKIMSSMRIPALVSSVILIVLYLVMFDYVRKLEGIPGDPANPPCPCSEGWRRTYIFWYIIASIFIILMNSIIFMFDIKGPLTIVMGVIAAIYQIATILFVIFAIQYVNRLKREKCECSEAVGRNILQVVSWFYVVMWAVVLVSMLFMGLVVGSLVTK
jgi:hypothetical protein